MSAACRESFRHAKTDERRNQDNEPVQAHSTEGTIAQLVVETCRYPPNSLKRRQNFNHLVQAIIDSGKLWWENTPYYNDALQQTWLYLCRNLCQATTGAQYDADRSQVTTWLNQYLKRRLQDFYLEAKSQQEQQVDPPISDAGQPLDLLENLPAAPQIPPILEETRNWAKTDPHGELRCIHIKGRPDLTGQMLILRRLPPETDWKTLEKELNCSYSTLANFYQRQCLPRLRKFGESQGYI